MCPLTAQWCPTVWQQATRGKICTLARVGETTTVLQLKVRAGNSRRTLATASAPWCCQAQPRFTWAIATTLLPAAGAKCTLDKLQCCVVGLERSCGHCTILCTLFESLKYIFINKGSECSIRQMANWALVLCYLRQSFAERTQCGSSKRWHGSTDTMLIPFKYTAVYYLVF